jgi:hypothetical protein
MNHEGIRTYPLTEPCPQLTHEAGNRGHYDGIRIDHRGLEITGDTHRRRNANVRKVFLVLALGRDSSSLFFPPSPQAHCIALICQLNGERRPPASGIDNGYRTNALAHRVS